MIEWKKFPSERVLDIFKKKVETLDKLKVEAVLIGNSFYMSSKYLRLIRQCKVP